MFKIHTIDDGRNAPVEYLPCGAITPKAGMAMVLTSGNLAVAAGTNKPAYICMREETAAVPAGTLIPVIRVQSDMVFETTATAALTSVKLGSKVTLSTDGLQVTATTTDGVAEIVAMDGTAAGSVVRVRF